MYNVKIRLCKKMVNYRGRQFPSWFAFYLAPDGAKHSISAKLTKEAQKGWDAIIKDNSFADLIVTFGDKTDPTTAFIGLASKVDELGDRHIIKNKNGKAIQELVIKSITKTMLSKVNYDWADKDDDDNAVPAYETMFAGDESSDLPF